MGFRRLFYYTGYPQELSLNIGKYLFECWGAEGGTWDSENFGGRGAYTRGVIKLNRRTKFYIYVGEKGSTTTGSALNLPPTYNGGGIGGLSNNTKVYTHYGSSGGGATDIRTVGGPWDDEESLNSRIMVASGGGGATSQGPPSTYPCRGGHGGTIEGGPGVYAGTRDDIGDALGGNQESGGRGGLKVKGESTDLCRGTNGSKGKGGNYGNCYSGSGGGGGYYGGGGSGVVSYSHQCGAGGSSYISGNLLFGGSRRDWKELRFTNSHAKGGNESVLSPFGVLKRGNEGNGYVRITYLNQQRRKSKLIKLSEIIIFINYAPSTNTH